MAVFKNPLDMAKGLDEGWGVLPTPQLEEKYEDYNDYFAHGEPITRSEREFNLATGNDEPVYNYFYQNRKNLKDRIEKGEDYQNILKELHDMGTWSKGDYSPKAIRKEYLMRVLDRFEE